MRSDAVGTHMLLRSDDILQEDKLHLASACVIYHFPECNTCAIYSKLHCKPQYHMYILGIIGRLFHI